MRINMINKNVEIDWPILPNTYCYCTHIKTLKLSEIMLFLCLNLLISITKT